MTSSKHGPVVRRWGFFANDHLAYAGVAHQSGPLELHLRIFEAEQHSHTASLPERIRLEQLIRVQVSADVEQSLGVEWIALFHFEPQRQNEHRLARDVFNAPLAKPFSGK